MLKRSRSLSPPADKPDPWFDLGLTWKRARWDTPSLGNLRREHQATAAKIVGTVQKLDPKGGSMAGVSQPHHARSPSDEAEAEAEAERLISEAYEEPMDAEAEAEAERLVAEAEAARLLAEANNVTQSELDEEERQRQELEQYSGPTPSTDSSGDYPVDEDESAPTFPTEQPLVQSDDDSDDEYDNYSDDKADPAPAFRIREQRAQSDGWIYLSYPSACSLKSPWQNIAWIPGVPFRFLDLPAELRNAIFVIAINDATGAKGLFKPPSITRASRQLRAETMGIYLSLYTFKIHFSQLTKWLNALERRGACFLRRVIVILPIFDDDGWRPLGHNHVYYNTSSHFDFSSIFWLHSVAPQCSITFMSNDDIKLPGCASTDIARFNSMIAALSPSLLLGLFDSPKPSASRTLSQIFVNGAAEVTKVHCQKELWMTANEIKWVLGAKNDFRLIINGFDWTITPLAKIVGRRTTRETKVKLVAQEKAMLQQADWGSWTFLDTTLRATQAPIETTVSASYIRDIMDCDPLCYDPLFESKSRLMLLPSPTGTRRC